MENNQKHHTLHTLNTSSINTSSINNTKHVKVNMILAHDESYGIGVNGDLPWTQCKDDMRLFRRLTTGTENGNNFTNSFDYMNSYLYNDSMKIKNVNVMNRRQNAVIMGYNTWKSLPKNHRPLKNRVNIVLSNNHYDELCNDPNFINGNCYQTSVPINTYSNANANINTHTKTCGNTNTFCYIFTNWFDVKQHLEVNLFSGVGKYKEAWIIGGSEIYKGAIDNLDISLIYRTKFKKKYICDKFFNIDSILLEKGYHTNKTVLNDTNDYVVECLEVKQGVVC